MQKLRLLARSRNSSTFSYPEKDHSSFFSSDFYFANESLLPIWRTCLREVVFLPSDIREDLATDWRALDEAESLCFLTEVLCGLHSPLLGENEVFGQFKQFIDEQRSLGAPLFSESQKWLQFLVQNVKHFRHNYGRYWGSNSYGSLLRKKIEPFENITLFGTGHLAEEIFPWLSHKKALQLAGRNEERLQFFASKYLNLSVINTGRKMDNVSFCEKAFHPCLILSASLSNEQTLELLNVWGTQVRILFDLRGMDSKVDENVFRSSLREQFPKVEVVFLQELFEALSQHQENIQCRLEEVKLRIHEKVHEFVHRLEHRPLGWDDLCA